EIAASRSLYSTRRWSVMKRSFRRTLVALLPVALPLAAACSDDGPPVTSERLPSVDPSGVPSGAFSGELGQAAIPCLVRFDFAAPSSDVDCTVDALGGSGDWKLTCPAHSFIPMEDDRHFDADGRLISETVVEPPPPLGDGHTYRWSTSGLAEPPCMPL